MRYPRKSRLTSKKMTLHYLRAQAQTIQQQLKNTPINSAEWQTLRNQLLTVQAQLGQAQGAIRGLIF
jgi:hypothetical protein